MRRGSWIGLAVAVFTGLAALHSRERAEEVGSEPTASGVVFHDQNGNGVRDHGELGIPGVRVSNGEEITRTDRDGQYALPVSDDCTIFVIKPSGWATPLSDDNIPQFYYTHKPNGSPSSHYPGVAPTGPLPDSVDFALRPQEEPDRFEAILFGDPQPRNQKELDYITHDVLEDLVGTDAAFGVTLGDILFDDLSLFGPQSQAVGLIGIPWYNVIGNHDINFDAPNDALSDETFERHFGPNYYSFDYGTAHFIVIDNIDWHEADDGKRKYRGGIGDKQLGFIEQDLSMIPEEQLVVLLMHIPITGVHDRSGLYRLIESRPACISISGHTHHHEHRFITEADGWRGDKPHHHLINVTVSGSWWAGAPDERGIPHTLCADGTPNGYTVLTCEGRDYSFRYRAASRSAEYQMEIDAPEAVELGKLAGCTISANVFNGSSRSTVEMQVGSGEWIPMNYVVKNDPSYVAVFEAEKKIADKKWRNMSGPRSCHHLWQATMPPGLAEGAHCIRIRSRDMFGQEVTGSRIIRVVPDAAR